MRIGRTSGWFLAACAISAAGIAGAQTATETVLHSFGYFTKGANPYGTLFRNAQGVMYGTTWDGGSVNEGVVYELGSAGYRVLYSFTITRCFTPLPAALTAGAPFAGVVRDAEGNLYGTTYMGGAGCGLGCGVVYVVSPSGQETVLHAFTGYADGSGPESGGVLGPDGSLYGTTPSGGLGAFTFSSPGSGFSGGGVAYRMSVR
jgi:uncharacterized repeat protein (TIGR03803 family)